MSEISSGLYVFLSYPPAVPLFCILVHGEPDLRYDDPSSSPSFLVFT